MKVYTIHTTKNTTSMRMYEREKNIIGISKTNLHKGTLSLRFID